MTNFSEVSSEVSNHNKRHGCNRTDLEFTHIPKNAGTSIENAGKKAGICWGRFSLFHNRKMCSTWHQPPRINKDLHQGKKTFCVIRDPKERIVSEYRYRWAKKHGNNPRTTCTARGLNGYIQGKLKPSKDMRREHFGNCHFLSQVAYLHPSLGGHDIYGCTIAIRFENLAEEFSNFARKYLGLELELGIANQRSVKQPESRKQVCTLTVDDLYENSSKLIGHLYRHDYQAMPWYKRD